MTLQAFQLCVKIFSNIILQENKVFKKSKKELIGENKTFGGKYTPEPENDIGNIIYHNCTQQIQNYNYFFQIRRFLQNFLQTHLKVQYRKRLCT